MTDFILAGILLMIVGGAVFYIVKAKKNGARCVGCSNAGNCAGATCGKACTMNCQNDTK